MKYRPHTTIGILAAVLLGIAVYIYGFHGGTGPSLPKGLDEVAVTPAEMLQGFELYDHQEQPIGLDDLRGHWTFISFGFTQCPDICPATLSQLALLNRAIQQSPQDISAPRFLFVSVDPKRDTPAHLGAYVTYFDPSFNAASGRPDELSEFEKQLGAFHRYINEGGDGNYTVEHSADIFLVDPKGRLVAKFRPPMNIKRVAGQYKDLVDLYGEYQT